jgi:hypothetical protein
MVVISSLFALAFGLSLGLIFDNVLALVAISLLIPSLFWGLKAFNQSNHHSEAIHSSSLPMSIFKSEFDDMEFTDDRERLSRKRTVSTAMSYVVGVFIGGVVAPIVSANL